MQDTWVRPLDQEDPLEKGNGNPLQYSCLENPMDREAWQATVHGVAKSWIERLTPLLSLFIHGQTGVLYCKVCTSYFKEERTYSIAKDISGIFFCRGKASIPGR